VQGENALLAAASLAHYTDFAQTVSIEVGMAGDIPPDAAPLSSATASS